MRGLELVEPSVLYKALYMEFLNECKADIENLHFESFIPISNNSTFKNDVRLMLSYSKGENLQAGWVAGSTFWLLNEVRDKIIGVLSIRHSLTKQLCFRGGHIGYYIRISERRKGYATKMLGIGLEKCIELGIGKVLVTCSKSNIGSIKTILNNAGIFDSEDIEVDEIFQRYWIET